MNEMQSDVSLQEMHFKCVVVGDKDVGKSSIIKRFTTGQFSGPLTNMTLGVKTTAGHAKIEFLESDFAASADCAIVVFDLARQDSFENVEAWKTRIEKRFGNIPIVVLGNKVELGNSRMICNWVRSNPKSALTEALKAPNVVFHSVSARCCKGLDYPILTLCRFLIDQDLVLDQEFLVPLEALVS